MLNLTLPNNGIVNIDPDRITAIEEYGSGTLVYFPGGSIRVKENRATVYGMMQTAGALPAPMTPAPVPFGADGRPAVTDPTLAPMGEPV